MKAEDTVETRYKFYKTNLDLYNEVLSETNDFFTPIIIYWKEPRYNEASLKRTIFASPLAFRFFEVPLCKHRRES